MAGVDDAQTRLATYGTLAPGRPNHHQLADLRGHWQPGSVRGRLTDQGWGAALGYPGLLLGDQEDEVAVQLFESADLPAHWARLDAFEGEGYRRVPVEVTAGDRKLTAFIYVVRPPEP